MRKIKKFKIQVYSYEVLRRARKHKLDLAGAGLDDEGAMREYASALATALEPAVVFDYLPPEDALAMRINGDEPVPLTVGILTLGGPFERKVDAETDETHRKLNLMAAQIFISTAVGVTAGLALREAEPEGFELEAPRYISSCPEPEVPAQESSSVPLYENELVKSLFEKLEADKIGVSFDAGAFTPKYSAVFALPWLSRKKKKGAAASKKG